MTQTKNNPKTTPQFWAKITTILTILLSLQIQPLVAINSDGNYLLALKHSILNEPLSVLHTWNYLDSNPCSWHGVTCSKDKTVISLSLPHSHLVGPIPVELGLIQHLQRLDLSHNFLNGTLPTSLFTLPELQLLSVSSNSISGELPKISGGGLNTFLEVLDLSSNLFNGSLPSDPGGPRLRYLNLSYNRFSGSIPQEFAAGLPENATIDVSFNNLTGQIPGSKALSGQDSELFSGNQFLCGKPLKNLCVIPSTLSNPPNVSASIPPAIAVIPRSYDSNADKNSSGRAQNIHSNGLKPAAIVGITMADLVGILVLGVIFVYLYQLRSKKQTQNQDNPDSITGDSTRKKGDPVTKDHFLVQIDTKMEGANNHTNCLINCLRGKDKDSEDGAQSEARTSEDEAEGKGGGGGGGVVVMVDGETEMEVETLLKASAYILGGSGESLVYKAVLQDGIAYTVRRLGGENGGGVEKLRDFEGQVKAIAKLRHPNLVRVRGFYWGSNEKLIIYDYVSNGNLATCSYKKNGSTPYHVPLQVRLKIARGVARGLNYIHEKRFVHGNIKPSNILLTTEMEPIISDLGLSWLVHGTNKGGSLGSCSARQFGSKRSMGSYDWTHDLSVSGSPYISPLGTTNGPTLPYQAPESLKNLKPNPKWDVYSFGIILLELLIGKVSLDQDLGQWTPSHGLEDRYWVLKMVDVSLRAEIHGKEEAIMGLFKLGFSCASLVPQKRPSMKEALQVFDKVLLSMGQ